MLNFNDEKVRKFLFEGLTGLEKEGLRVTGDGFFALTPHPFSPDDRYIVRDFCENQTEINTPPKDSAKEAWEELKYQTQRIRETLKKQKEREYLWPFSNPPYILDEENIPIAQFEGKDSWKTEYREYLAMRYGRYKMTFSGIHFNYSFGDELLKADHKLSGISDFEEYKNSFYVSLAAKALLYNWIVVAVSAASPLLDSSYFEKGKCGEDVFNGMASSRCSDIGYWNFFTPLLDYTDLPSYVKSIDSIEQYELIRSPSELYFPVRVKPAGGYTKEALQENGAGHIELRMIDLNPLDEAGIDVRDVFFFQLFLIFLACREDEPADANAQIKAIANTKNAARYDLKTVHLVTEKGESVSIADAAVRFIDEMRGFFKEYGRRDIEDALLFERAKFTEIRNRYAYKVRELYSDGFVKKGMKMLKGESGKAENTLRSLLYEKYIAPTKKKKGDFIGIEIEMPILNLSKEGVDFKNVHRVTAKFMEHFGFKPAKTDENADVCLAEHESKEDSLSYDCSYNNLELSLGKVKDISEAEERFKSYYGFLQESFAEYGYTLTGMGINPYRIYNQNIPVPNGRYRMLFHHLHSYDRYRTLPMYFHPHPEFGTFASASQVQLDVTYDDIPEVINTFSLLEPVKALIFSNSVLLGEAEDYLCYRDILWENSTHGINPHNVGPYEYTFRDVDDLLDYIQSTSIYCAERGDKYVNFRMMPLRDYFMQDEVEGEYYADGRYHKIIINPRKDDIEYLRSFKHEDLTYRGTVEFRSVCCQPIKDAMSVAAFHAGLKKKLHELTGLLESDHVLYGHGYNATELRHLFIRKDLPSFVDADDVYLLAQKILELAGEGLYERGYGEERFLKPLFERVKNRENPASYMLGKLSQGSTVEDIIKEYS
ncbi:MAG: hypothetical protein K6F86_09340 [Lachnospiraceae bacterium]|nr:hypothetical protein [Lachnospiraceae bacterium]